MRLTFLKKMKKLSSIPLDKIKKKRKENNLNLTCLKKFIINPKLQEEESSKNNTTVVRLKKRNGIIIQDCDIYIGRACSMGGWNLEQSKWANPFTIREYGSVEKVCDKYREYILKNNDLMNSLHELEGKRLGCWCKNKPSDLCHGDILIELINQSKLLNNK
jgi:hypothetical protein